MSSLAWLELVKECTDARGLDFNDALERLHGNHLYTLALAEFHDSHGESVKEPKRLIHQTIQEVFFDNR